MSITAPLFGIHLLLSDSPNAQKLVTIVPRLRGIGVNSLIVEINYNFEFHSHPELRLGTDPVTQDDAQALVEVCQSEGIELIPQFQCLGHQSWAEKTFPLLTVYPEFDETPDQFPDNRGIYCRSWCPRHPGVNKIIFRLFEEFINAFQTKAFHVGMDEVFLIADDGCSRCRGREPGEIFAESVNAYYNFLVKKCGVEMLIWGDRLLDASVMDYGLWEASKNGTHTAINRIPRDIIICDWHYEQRTEYPSVQFFQEKGFRVWPAGWRDPDASQALYHSSQMPGKRTEKMLGFLCTTWGAVSIEDISDWKPVRIIAELMKKERK